MDERGSKALGEAERQLHIAMLGHKRIPSREGGVEVVVEELAARMVRLGHAVTCYNRRGSHVSGKEFDTKRMSDYRGIRLKYVPTIDHRGWAAMTASVFGALRAAFGRYDVVHFHAEGPCCMLWLPKLTGKRCVATIHGLDHRRVKWGRLAQTYIRLGERCAVKYADEIIVLSRSMQQYFLDTYGRATQYVPNGVNRPVLRAPELIRARYQLRRDGYFLYVGRLVPEKGLRRLIEAFRAVHTDRQLIIAGGASDTGDFVRELQKLAAPDPRIRFTGFVQGALLDELYSNAYVYVLPSDLEGMPLSLLEAMSYGNCCLVSDIDECMEVVENRADAFPHGNTAALRDRLQQLNDDAALVAHYRAGAADFITNKYNWDDTVACTLELYHSEHGHPCRSEHSAQSVSDPAAP